MQYGLEPLTHLALRVPAVVIASLAVGEQFQRWRLPVITGYLLTGLLAGPWVLGLINPGGLPLVSGTHHPSTNIRPRYVNPHIHVAAQTAQQRPHQPHLPPHSAAAAAWCRARDRQRRQQYQDGLERCGA